MNETSSDTAVKVRGFFRVAIEDSGEIVGDSGWMPNVVTNDGFNQYLVISIYNDAEDDWDDVELYAKPCPFNHSEIEGPLVIADLKMESDYDRERFFVWCCACDAQGPVANSETEAVELWNRRAQVV